MYVHSIYSTNRPKFEISHIARIGSLQLRRVWLKIYYWYVWHGGEKLNQGLIVLGASGETKMGEKAKIHYSQDILLSKTLLWGSVMIVMILLWERRRWTNISECVRPYSATRLATIATNNEYLRRRMYNRMHNIHHFCSLITSIVQSRMTYCG